MAINKVSSQARNIIKRKSAFALPDRPSEAGMSAEAIKKAFWQPVADLTDSALSEIDRVVDEVNAYIGNATPAAISGWTLQQGDNVLSNVRGYYIRSGSFLFACGTSVSAQLQKVNASVVINLPKEFGNVTWATGQVSTAAAAVQGDPYIITAPASGMSAANKVWITTAPAAPGGQFTPSNFLNISSFWFAAITDSGTPEAMLLDVQNSSGNYTAGQNIDITNGVISVITTNTATEDGTRPITAGGVYNIVGNIEAILQTI